MVAAILICSTLFFGMVKVGEHNRNTSNIEQIKDN
jgi:hypothetical protein